MRPEDRLLFLCARQDFNEAHIQDLLELCRCQVIDWATVLATATQHSIDPLVYRNLTTAKSKGLEIPIRTIHDFRFFLTQHLATKAGWNEKLAETLAFLAPLGIDAMAIKSTALDLLIYEQPWYTLADDMDLILRPHSTEVPPQVSRSVKQFFRAKAPEIEYEYYQHHDVAMNGALQVDFDRIWQDATAIPFQAHTLYLMSTEDMLLSLCINSARKRYFRLKSLCDIAETVARSRQLDWHLLVEKAQNYGCSNIVYAALLVTQMTVGCNVPSGVLDQLAVGRVKALILQHLIHFLIDKLSLPALSNYSGSEILTRKVGWSLVLPYVSYDWQQRWSKIHEAFIAWQQRDLPPD